MIFLLLRQELGSPVSLISFDTLVGVPGYLYVAAFLLCLALLLERSGERGRTFARVVTCDDSSDEDASRATWVPLLAGIAFLAAILVLLERHQPFFFTQDDNLAQFLPVMLQGGRSVARGIFPTWNPYQLLGAPTASLGVYSLTNPFLYLSYFVSRVLFRNEFMTVEVFSVLHIVLGYLATYWAARCYRVRPVIAALAGLSVVLSGWNLIASRSWYYVSPVALFLPLLIVGVAKLPRASSGWRWIAGMGLVIGLFFHAGNVQFWTYGLMFLWFALMVQWLAGVLKWSHLIRAAAATLLGIALSCPLLIPQFIETRDVLRRGAVLLGNVTGQWLAFFIPGPWIHAYQPSDWLDPQWKTGGLMVYSGTTFVTLAAVLVLCILFYRLPREAYGKNIWIFCAGISLLAAMGVDGAIWPIMLRLPLLSKFRLPMKFIAFFNVFAVLAGAVVCERVLRSIRRPKVAQACITVITAGLIAASCMFYLPSWYTYGIRSFPDGLAVLRTIAEAKDAHYRVLSYAQFRSRSPRYWESLPSNLATVYEVPAWGGYDPLVEFSPRLLAIAKNLDREGLELWREFGVRYVLVPNDIYRPRFGGYPGVWRLERDTQVPGKLLSLVQASPVVFHDEEITIHQLADAKPLAFSLRDPATPVPLQLRADGLDLDTSSLRPGEEVTLNFLWRPEMKATANGQPVALRADGQQRMVVQVPSGAENVKIRFVPPWKKGFAAGALLFCVALLAGFVVERRR